MHRRDIFRKILLKKDQKSQTGQEGAWPIQSIVLGREGSPNNALSSIISYYGSVQQASGAKDEWIFQEEKILCQMKGDRTILPVPDFYLENGFPPFKMYLNFQFMTPTISSIPFNAKAGIRFGIRESKENKASDQERQGFDIGLTHQGHLFIGEVSSHQKISEKIRSEEVGLVLSVRPQSDKRLYIKLALLDGVGNTQLVLRSSLPSEMNFIGRMTLVCEGSSPPSNQWLPQVAFSKFQLPEQNQLGGVNIE